MTSSRGCLTGLMCLAGLYLCAAERAQVLPTGVSITPTAVPGTTIETLNPGLPSLPDYLADMAVTMGVSPDGRTLLVLTSGYNQNYDAMGNTEAAASNEYVFVYDIAGGAPRQTQVLQIKVNAFDGLAWNPDGREFYVSGGADDLVHVFGQGASGWAEGKPITLNHNGQGLGLYGISPLAAGLAATRNGKYLLAANFDNDSVSAVDLKAGKAVAELDLRPGKLDPTLRGKPGGSYPFWVSIKGNTKAYVSSQRDREIIVLDLSALPKLRVAGRIAVNGQPGKMMLNREQSKLYVVLDTSDLVAEIDTAKDEVLRAFGTIAPENVFPNKQEFRGAEPNALELAPDEATLYVTDGNTNAVAVIDLEAGRVRGLIPTGWYPDAIRVSGDGSLLYVANGKSVPGPNPRACTDKIAVQTGNYAACTSANQYIYQIMQAGLATIPVPSAAELENATRQAAANNHFDVKGKPDSNNGLMAFLRNRIHHVIYIVKENRTYDQVLGDLEKGNGDPSLVALPEPISPNHHQLARQFVTLDNTYCSGEVSGDGWNWSAAARVNDEEQKTIQLDYAGRGAPYDYDGTNRNINVGYATLAERREANPDTPDDPDLLAGTRDVAEHDGPGEEAGTGYLWDAALRARRTVRNYGFEYIDLNRYSLDPSDPNHIPVLRMPFDTRTIVSRATKASLRPNTDPYFRGWDMNIPDYWLYKEWAREFDGYAANGDLPALEMVALPHDHFGSFSTAIDGVNTIETQMADNDYALGLLVRKVSTSRYKDDTLIFVIEDDAQDGPDHVDAHRTIAYVIGPYVKQKAVVSTRYSTVNMVRTIEELLGLEPLGLNDGLQPPMTDVFTYKNRAWAYEPIVPAILRTTQLPLPKVTQSEQARAAKARVMLHDAAYWAEKTRGFDFSRPDRVNAALFNRLLWAGLRGEETLYPSARSGRNLRRNRKQLLRVAARGGAKATS